MNNLRFYYYIFSIILISILLTKFIFCDFFFKFSSFFGHLIHLVPVFLLIFLSVLLIFFDNRYLSTLKDISLLIQLIVFVYYIYLFTYISNFAYTPTFYFKAKWFDFFNLNLIFAVDNINIFFLLLIALLFPICLLISWKSVRFNFKFFILVLVFLEIFLLLTFLSYNLFFFYFFFECTLIPMFLLIGIWGSRQRKIHAVYQYFFYTVFGSLFLLAGMLLFYYATYTLDLDALSRIKIDFNLQVLIFIFLFVGFCVKIPMVPFHIWLPEAHVEAPTSGSIILAGILLKVGSYGIFRFVIALLPQATSYFSSSVYFLCLASIIYISCIAIRQNDMKKIIAYSSIAHMSFVMMGLFSLTAEGIGGAIFLMLSHGLVSSALFICISIIYDRYHSRLITYYGSLVYVMPIYSLTFFLFTLANVSFPGTTNFVGELLVLVGTFEDNLFVALVACFSIVISAIYSFWLINRVIFGVNKKNLIKFSDLNRREFYILFLLIFLTIFFGIYPNLIFKKMEFMIYYILSRFF